MVFIRAYVPGEYCGGFVTANKSFMMKQVKSNPLKVLEYYENSWEVFRMHQESEGGSDGEMSVLNVSQEWFVSSLLASDARLPVSVLVLWTKGTALSIIRVYRGRIKDWRQKLREDIQKERHVSHWAATSSNSLRDTTEEKLCRFLLDLNKFKLTTFVTANKLWYWCKVLADDVQIYFSPFIPIVS